MSEEDEQFVVKSYKTSVSRYLMMGKLGILKSRLYDGKLRVVYASSLNTHPKYKSTPVSNDFIKCLMDLLTNKEHFDMYLFMALNFNESKLMLRLLGDSNYGRMIGFDEVKAYKNRMKILQGELATGNDNKELINDCLDVLKRLRQLNAISLTEAKDIIKDLEDY